jgi:DNA-binding CsgD family transcriptional regulator
MLLGRSREQADITRLLDGARAGRGGALVLRGEPGIGKSALLEDAAGRARGLRVLRAAGVASETMFAYATLHRLLRPLLDQVPRLPAPQAGALRLAFGLGPATGAGAAPRPPDRFLVSLAALTLLSEAAAATPVLCLVDDLHLADAPSAEALAFTGRRLGSEPVALLVALREVDPPEEARSEGGRAAAQLVGVPELHLAGLDPTSAAALVARRHGLRLPPAARQRLVQATGGNPLALLELPDPAATGWPLALDDPPGRPLPLASKLERAFLERVRRHPRGAQTVLLLAAAEASGQLRTIRAAAERLGLDPDLLETGELGDLIGIDGATVTFRHPLVRSAVYHGAASSARRAAHRALAEALAAGGAADDPAQADRRAWHCAAAADGPDEPVAAELEAAARRALGRSGHLPAAAALERSAALSATAADRARRLVAAASAAWLGGDAARAQELLARAERAGPADAEAWLDLEALRSLIELRAGVPADALATLLPAARAAARTDPHRAVRLLLQAGEAAFDSGRSEAFREITEVYASLPPDLEPPDALLVRLHLAASPAGASSPERLRDDLAQVEGLDDPDLLRQAGGLVGWGLNDGETARRLQHKAAALARARGAAGVLAMVLVDLTKDEVARGRYASAEAYAHEGRELALESGQPVVACEHEANLAEVAALRGRASDARELARRVLAQASQHRLAAAAIHAHRALAYLALAAGPPEEARRHLEALLRLGPPGHRAVGLFAVPDLVEAAVRARRPVEGIDQTVADLAAWAEGTGSADAQALTARARALLQQGEPADRSYRQALGLHAATDRPFDRARTHLVYGEFLRRTRRRGAARPHLREAVEAFQRLGAPLWAKRAQAELRATGETITRYQPDGLARLTPQQLQIVRAVAQGITNREVAAQLFLSPRTVDYHLRRIFRQLGITSRAELVRLAVTSEALGETARDDRQLGDAAAGAGGTPSRQPTLGSRHNHAADGDRDHGGDGQKGADGVKQLPAGADRPPVARQGRHRPGPDLVVDRDLDQQGDRQRRHHQQEPGQ